MNCNDMNSAQLDSDLLRTFLAVAATGSISDGASRLLRTQSAVSLQLRKLEGVVGQRLFDRHRRGLSMTVSGLHLLPVARSVVETLDQTVLDLRGTQARGEIRLGFPEEYSDTVLPWILAAYAEAQPGARILLSCGSGIDFPLALAAGELDLALHSPKDFSEGDISIHAETAVWVGSVYHEVEDRRPLPVASFDRTCWWWERSLDVMEKAGLNYEIVCTSESVAGVRAAIAAGMAVGVLPQSSLTGNLRKLPNDPFPCFGETNLVLTRGAQAPEKLTNCLTEIISKAFLVFRPA